MRNLRTAALAVLLILLTLAGCAAPLTPYADPSYGDPSHGDPSHGESSRDEPYYAEAAVSPSDTPAAETPAATEDTSQALSPTPLPTQALSPSPTRTPRASRTPRGSVTPAPTNTPIPTPTPPAVDMALLSANDSAPFRATELSLLELLPYDDIWYAEELFGLPDSVEMTEDDIHYWISYRYEGLTIRFASYSYGYLFQGVEVSDSSFEGPRGIRVGDALEDVIDAFRVMPFTLTPEQEKSMPLLGLPKNILYGTIYDVNLWSVPEFTQIAAPMGYIEGVANRENAMRIVYIDPLSAYGLLSEREQMLVNESLAYLYIDIVGGKVESYSWTIIDLAF